jgi:fatty acid desaturase
LMQRGQVIIAVVVAFATCFAAFVQMHDALHDSLGLGKRGHAVVLSLSALLILKSGHALKATHLRHHGRCLGEDDPEGAPANWSLWRVLFAGPFHILGLRRQALSIAPRTRAIQYAETTATVLILISAILTYARSHILAGVFYWGVAAMVSATMPLWAAFIPHRLASKHPTIRAAARLAQLWTPIVNSFAFHHLHHRFPKVPTALLPLAAERAGDEHEGHTH